MAPKRAFGGVLRSFGGGFRGPNRERASVFSGAGRGRCRWFCGGAGAGPARSAARDRAVQVVLRWSPEAEPACSAAQDGGRNGEVLRRRRGRGQRVQRRGIGAGRGVQRCRRDGPAAGSQKKCSEGKMRPPPGRKKVFRGEGAPPPEHIRAQKKTDLGPFTSTLLPYGLLLRDTHPIPPPSHNNGPALREPVSFAGDFRQHVLLQQPVCLRFRSARRSGSQP